MPCAGPRKRVLQPAKLPGGTEPTQSAPSPIYVDMHASLGVPPAQTSSSPRPQSRALSVASTWCLLFPFTPTNKLRELVLQADEDDGDACDTNNSSPSYIMRQLHDQLVQPNRTDGALRSGGVISLWNRSHVGLVISSVLAGFMLGALPSTIVSLKVQARVATTAQLLGPAFSPIYGLSSPVMFFPASLRFSFGLVSDIFPIYGSHRMPYMLMGWAASFVSFLIGGLLLSTSVIQEPSLLLMLIACSGVTMADVAGDGLLVELAQREPVAFRGRTQGIVLAFKFLGVALSQAYIAVLEGSLFTQWTPSDPNYLGLIYSLAMLSVVPTPFVYFLATSRHPPGALPTSLTTSSPRASFLDNVIALWTCLQSKAIAAYLLFSFLFSLAIHVGNGGTSVFKREVLDVWIERSWLHHGDANVAPRQSLFVVGAGAIVFGLAMVAVTKRRWKAALAWSTIAIGVVGSLHASCTVYGTSRVPWFWYGTLLVLQVPHGIRHIVSLLPVVEYAPVGFEATMSSLAMSVQLVAVPIVTAVYSTTLQDTLVNVLEADTASITPSVQTQVGDLMALGPLASFGVFVSLIWLPNSPVEAQVWRWGGGQSRAAGWSVVALWWAGCTLLLVTSTLTMYSSWSCGVVLGGIGCSGAIVPGPS